MRPLAYLRPAHGAGAGAGARRDAGTALVCASCAGQESVFACGECGREDHPYGASRCARCILAERLTVLLTDPTTGRIHHQLQRVFEELVTSDRPQTGIWWLRKMPGVGPRLLGAMARGEIEISHDTFRSLPSDRVHDYLRGLLVALEVLPPFEVRIERMLPWIESVITDLPADQAALVRQFAHWHVLRQMRKAAREGRLTSSITNAARRRIRLAVNFLTFLQAHGATAATATQDLLERYGEHVGGLTSSDHSFIAWLRRTRLNTHSLTIPHVASPSPTMTVSDSQRWDAVERLLRDQSLRTYTRIGGLFTLLFAQPLSRIVAMRTRQVTLATDSVHVTFNTIPIQMPPQLDDLIREHLEHRGKSLYASSDNGWLFPGGNPGRHLVTENIRAQLVAIGIKPYENRKATLFQLAGDMPAPVLAELIGITNSNASDWARLAARDWTTYLATRTHFPRS